MRARRAAFAIVSAAVMLVAGCDSHGSTPADAATVDGVRLYGVDGNMGNSLGEPFKKTPGAISGMVGTMPLTPLSEDFKQRLLAVDPSLTEFEYSGESYDAVAIAALAVQVAHTTDPVTVAKYINGVTTLVPGGVECSTLKECFAGIAAGKDIAYRGVTIRSGFTDAGEPSTTSYGTLHFGQDNKIDNGKTEFVSAGDETLATKTAPPAPGGAKGGHETLKLGLLLPRTGDLSAEGLPMFAAAHLAIKEINELGGVLGHPVAYEDADDGTDPAKSTASFDKLVADGIGIIIGPSTSGESTALIPKAVATGRILISVSATAASLTKADDHGLFFRTSPSDLYQAQALADVLMRAGARRVFIAARDNPYGTGLRDGVVDDLVKAGVKKLDIGGVTYKDGQKDYSDVVLGVKSFKPDSVVLIGYGEAAQIIVALVNGGVQLAH
jgi:branched-chain amino acid transport system substrate-binding protein